MREEMFLIKFESGIKHTVMANNQLDAVKVASNSEHYEELLETEDFEIVYVPR